MTQQPSLRLPLRLSDLTDNPKRLFLSDFQRIILLGSDEDFLIAYLANALVNGKGQKILEIMPEELDQFVLDAITRTRKNSYDWMWDKSVSCRSGSYQLNTADTNEILAWPINGSQSWCGYMTLTMLFLQIFLVRESYANKRHTGAKLLKDITDMFAFDLPRWRGNQLTQSSTSKDIDEAMNASNGLFVHWDSLTKTPSLGIGPVSTMDMYAHYPFLVEHFCARAEASRFSVSSSWSNPFSDEEMKHLRRVTRYVNQELNDRLAATTGVVAKNNAIRMITLKSVRGLPVTKSEIDFVYNNTYNDPYKWRY